MPRTDKPPRLTHHKPTARVRLNGRDFYCGAFGTKAAKLEYARLDRQGL